MFACRRRLLRPLAPGPSGLSIIEVLMAAAIISIVGYYTLMTLGDVFAAKKDVEVSNYASQFEDPLRTAVGDIMLAHVEDKCFSGTSQAPIIGKQASTEYRMDAFKAPGVSKDLLPMNWRTAVERCSTSWHLDPATQTAHFCAVLTPTGKHRNRKGFDDPFDPDYVMAEFMFSLRNLDTGKSFSKCTAPVVSSGKKKSSLTSTSLTAKVAVAATEYTGNPDRGYRLVYTVFAYKKGGEGKRRFDTTTGIRQAGPNSRGEYCVTRSASEAKKPGSSGGNCDYIPTDLTAQKFEATQIEIPQEAMDLFYPPPPDPCEKDPNKEGCGAPGAGSGS